VKKDVQTETVREHEEAPRVKGPVRTCVGCGKADDAEVLVRVVLGPRESSGAEAMVAVDVAGGAHGRGAHVHARKACLVNAAKMGLARSFKAPVRATAGELAEQIVAGCDRRIAGLLVGAYRAHMVAAGADATVAALDRGADMVVVACDAGSVAEHGAIRTAVAEGRAIAWGKKETLGALFGRGEVAVCAVMNESIAAQVASARRLAEAAGEQSSARGEACRSPEAR
jgi:predicted RNA-binding protein YlxR (DUF448 family)/ribosomal protein L7Ae-like RNA K-turn-binding protein